MQLTPFPEYPGLQVHSKDPSVLLQAALASQLCSPVIHSFTSANQMQDLIIKTDLLNLLFSRIGYDKKREGERDFWLC